jgi:hypothetical protein
MRRWLVVSLLLAGCGSDRNLEHDLDPILLARAPVQPGGPRLGGLLALVTTPAGLGPLLIDTAFPMDTLARSQCPSAGPPGWTYTGRMDIHDAVTPTAPLRADFTNVGLFDICPGASGDPSVQPAGVMGGPLLSNFSVGFEFPTGEADPASMTLWPAYPGTDDQLAQDGRVALRFDPRGNLPIAQGDGEASLSLPNSRVVLAACVGPRTFATSEPAETCAHGEVALRASGEDMMLAIGTGEGPLILSQSAWARLAPKLGLDSEAGTVGQLYTPFTTVSADQPPVSARFVAIPRLAIFQGIPDSSWIGPCVELARARRIEWVLANQDGGACFQPCDASGGQAASTYPYLELGGSLVAAVVSETSDIIRSLNADVPAKPEVDGIVGAATLAGVRMRIDYPADPQGRLIASCLEGAVRETCFAAPSCPGLSAGGQHHTCFGQQSRGYAPVCSQ